MVVLPIARVSPCILVVALYKMVLVVVVCVVVVVKVPVSMACVEVVSNVLGEVASLLAGQVVVRCIPFLPVV